MFIDSKTLCSQPRECTLAVSTNDRAWLSLLPYQPILVEFPKYSYFTCIRLFNIWPQGCLDFYCTKPAEISPVIISSTLWVNLTLYKKILAFQNCDTNLENNKTGQNSQNNAYPFRDTDHVKAVWILRKARAQLYFGSEIESELDFKFKFGFLGSLTHSLAVHSRPAWVWIERNYAAAEFKPLSNCRSPPDKYKTVT